MVSFTTIRERLVVPSKDGDGSPPDRWNNRDLIPLPPSRRTWNDWDFIGFWAVIGFSISTWQSCSSLLAVGLNVWSSMVIVIIAHLITVVVAISHGWGGAVWHIGFTVVSRFTFGIWGSFLALIQRIVLCTVWYAVQSYTAGQCISNILSSIFPTFNSMKNTMPESLPMDTKQFIGFVLYHIVAIPFLYIPPEKLKHPFRYISLLSAITIFGTSIGQMVAAHGAGDLLHVKSTIPSGAQLGMAWMYGINSVINSGAVGLANQPDFSRFVQRPGQQVWGQTFSIMVLSNIVPLFGLLGTSAAASMYGDVNELNLWNPPNIILQWLDTSYSSRSRAAAFFASLGFLISTLGLNTIDNGMSGGMDLAGMMPKYINIRRGSYIIAIISIVIQPWQILANASVFLNVLGSYGVFLGPMIGVFTADYFIVRKQKLKLVDLYTASPSSIYWFWHGINWRSYASWVLGFIPAITGIGSVNPAMADKIPAGAVKLFQISFIIGFVIAFLLHVGFNYFWPPPGIGEVDDHDYFRTFTTAEANKLGIIPAEDSSEEPENTGSSDIKFS